MESLKLVVKIFKTNEIVGDSDRANKMFMDLFKFKKLKNNNPKILIFTNIKAKKNLYS